jgi:hypothetical protein
MFLCSLFHIFMNINEVSDWFNACLTGINVREHDIRFVEDNWESPVNSYLLLVLFFLKPAHVLVEVLTVSTLD